MGFFKRRNFIQKLSYF